MADQKDLEQKYFEAELKRLEEEKGDRLAQSVQRRAKRRARKAFKKREKTRDALGIARRAAKKDFVSTTIGLGGGVVLYLLGWIFSQAHMVPFFSFWVRRVGGSFFIIMGLFFLIRGLIRQRRAWRLEDEALRKEEPPPIFPRESAGPDES